MNATALILGAAALILVLLAGVLLGQRRGRQQSRCELDAALAAAHAETEELRRRLDSLGDRLERTTATMARTDDPAYVITDAGPFAQPPFAHPPSAEPPHVPDRVVLSATVGEPLVKVMAFGHGVRRALSAESRNRIWFEVRREVRRSRKSRRREMRDAWRREQAHDRRQDRDGQQAADAA